MNQAPRNEANLLPITGSDTIVPQDNWLAGQAGESVFAAEKDRFVLGFTLVLSTYCRKPQNLVFGRLQPLRNCRLNNRSIWQQDHEVKLPERTLDRVG